MSISQAIDKISDSAQSLANAFGQNSSGDGKFTGIYAQAKSIVDGYSELPWEFTGEDWYKVYGYQFAVKIIKAKPNGSSGSSTVKSLLGKAIDFVTGANDNANQPNDELVFTLPIPPQNFVVRMIPASQATPTIGGVVEETSANVFWMITMSGTTGIAVSRGGNTDRNNMASQFRDNVSTTGLLSGPLAGANAAISKIGGVVDQVIGAATSGSLAGVAGGLVGAVNTAILPPLPYAGSAVDQQMNGYTEIQELHRFLYTYSQIKSANPKAYSLFFRNYKSGQQWQVALQDFQIQQSAQNPMLYRYNIVMKAWNVSAVNKEQRQENDRFGPNGDLTAVNTLSPDKISQLGKSLYGG